MRKLFTSMAVSAVVLLPVSGYGQMGMMRDGHMDLRPMQDCGQMNISMKRHRFAMMNGIDERYTNKNNPLSPDSQIIASGKKLYEQNCASCHGATGLGNGEAGKILKPRPSNIAVFSKMPMATDGRQEERRVGKECVRPCRYRWSRDHEKKKIINKTETERK